MGQLTLPSGFLFDYKNLFGEFKVTKADVKALRGQVEKAHAAVQILRAKGIVKGHLSKDGLPEQVLFTQLPYVEEGHLNSPASLKSLQNWGASLRNQCDAVISLGIGGSYLGNKVLFDVQGGEFWNLRSQAEREGRPKLYFSGNNLDPEHVYQLIEQLRYEYRVKAVHSPAGTKLQVTLVVISKSGGTLETMADFLVIYQALCEDVHMEVKVVAVTDPAEGSGETLLHSLAKEQGWPLFRVPDGVGGRFSVFSDVGLVTAAVMGFDMQEFLAGARAMDEACQSGDVYQNPALLNAVLKFIAAETYGRDMEVFMPYADSLKSLSEWYVQLLAESLGKRTNREGEIVFYGRTPIVAVGTTDMHAQTQQHQDGKKNKLVQFVKVGAWQHDPEIPASFPVGKLADMAGLRLSQGLEAALNANAAALAADGRWNATFVLPQVNAFHLGEMMYLLALSVAYEGELANVDAFDQPGVEAYKRLMDPLLKEMKAGVK